ncbi:MAG: ATP-binding protein [Atribacterota bacterium]|jgi:ATP-dependent DNA helicase RecG|nr:ATP-binding protein [Atribacterota bacterium]
MNQDNKDIKALIQQGESLTLEFKSDVKSLPDRDLIAAVVSLANTEGGSLLLGVEDSGEVTGLHPKHESMQGLSAFIANKTTPPVSVEVIGHQLGDRTIAQIIVQKSRQLVSTSEGLLQRRRLKVDGTPEAVPFYPHEFTQRQSSMSLVDPSATLIEQVEVEQLDPIQRLRIRNAIKKYGGDQSLLPLADEELDNALGLVMDRNGERHPTVAGLLLLGTESLLRQYLPSYEVAFQVLRGTDVQVNEFYRKPLLETFEEVDLQFRPWIIEEEIQVGLFRVPVPNYDRRGFREAFVNALVHRDYSMLGAVHVKLDDDGLNISSPGGFIDGVNLTNLLVVSPRSRNPLLADIIKRIGLAERTGRGIDRIFEGMLRYGRPAPDYSLSNSYTVSLSLSNAAPDLEFLKMVVEHEDKLGGLPIDSLIILSRLREERRLTTADFVASVQKTETNVRATLEKLVEIGLLESHGTGRGRTYTLSAQLYQSAGQQAEYIRQAGFSPIQHEQMVLNYIDKHGTIKRADVADLCRITLTQGTRLLQRLVKAQEIRSIGAGKATRYERLL